MEHKNITVRSSKQISFQKHEQHCQEIETQTWKTRVGRDLSGRRMKMFFLGEKKKTNMVTMTWGKGETLCLSKEENQRAADKAIETENAENRGKIAEYTLRPKTFASNRARILSYSPTKKDTFRLWHKYGQIRRLKKKRHLTWARWCIVRIDAEQVAIFPWAPINWAKSSIRLSRVGSRDIQESG